MQLHPSEELRVQTVRPFSSHAMGKFRMRPRLGAAASSVTVIVAQPGAVGGTGAFAFQALSSEAQQFAGTFVDHFTPACGADVFGIPRRSVGLCNRNS